MAEADPGHIVTGRIKYGPVKYATGETPAAQRNPVAVLVCHGMGQQVRFETISAVAQAVLDEARNQGGEVRPVDVHLARANGDFLARAEISWTDLNGARHDVDVYEAYWAPLTEGKVSYWDTIRFLLQAGWNGLWFSKLFRKARFQRWVFGGRKDFTISGKTFVALLGVLLFVISQVALIALVSQQTARWVKDLADINLSDMNAILGVWHIAVSRWQRLLWWAAAIAWTAFLRYFIVEYAGDVAAYVSPYKDSKFDDLRHQIQAIGLNVGKVIYGFDDSTDTVPHYDRVVMIGHSLGSVVAYDTLNALINLDNVCGANGARQVVERTRALITFGSPLDKTAFIFRMQPRNTEDWLREQLAASVQPLIVDYKYRPASHFSWINIWSPADIISGELNYYDHPADPAANPQHIRNMIDPKAWVPLMAHVQYWKNPLLAQQIYKQVTRR